MKIAGVEVPVIFGRYEPPEEPPGQIPCPACGRKLDFYVLADRQTHLIVTCRGAEGHSWREAGKTVTAKLPLGSRHLGRPSAYVDDAYYWDRRLSEDERTAAYRYLRARWAWHRRLWRWVRALFRTPQA